MSPGGRKSQKIHRGIFFLRRSEKAEMEKNRRKQQKEGERFESFIFSPYLPQRMQGCLPAAMARSRVVVLT